MADRAGTEAEVLHFVKSFDTYPDRFNFLKKQLQKSHSSFPLSRASFILNAAHIPNNFLYSYVYNETLKAKKKGAGKSASMLQID